MHILKDNNRYMFYNELNIVSNLEPKNYLFKFHEEMGNCWLEDMDDFVLPDKVYDVHGRFLQLIKTSYDNEKKNLGILLTGNKGQGKSLTAKQICKTLNLPVIVISKAIPTFVNVIEFLSKIETDYVLFVDEFEKLFKEKGTDKTEFHTQETFLSYMDGSLSTKNRVVFLLTTNETVNNYLLNRPSRIKFLLEYNEMPEELFNMIVDDRLLNKEHKSDLESNISMVNINIDLLISIINDINVLNQPFSEFSKYYNYVFEKYRYEVSIIRDGKEKFDTFYTSEKRINYSMNYIANYSVHNMIKFTKDEIIFESEKWNDEKDDTETVQVKLVPLKMLSKTSMIV